MAHLFHHKFGCKDTIASHFEHSHERELHEWHSRSRFQAISRLLAEQVRSVVGSHHVEASAAQSFTQGITVGECLYGRVALYAVAKAGIVAVVEPQVMHAHLGCDMLLLNGRIAEKRQLALG